MRRTSIILLLATMLAVGCSTERRAIRQANRASAHIEKAKRIDPTIIQGQTVTRALALRSQKVESSITLPIATPLVNEQPVHAALNTLFPMYFEDDSLTASVYIQNGNQVLDYTIAPQPCDTIIRYQTNTIQPTKYEPMPLKWWQKALIALGCVFIVEKAIKLYFKKFKL